MEIGSANKLRHHSQVNLPKARSKEGSFTNVLKEKEQEATITQGKRRMLGRWALVNTGFRRSKIVSMKYADTSTDEDPIMTTVKGGEMIHINSIDPRNATQLEMRMYCAHLDATGRGNGGTFGTYQALSMSQLSWFLERDGNLENIVPTEYQFKTVTYDWAAMTKKYMGYIPPNDPKQYKDIEMIYDEMQKKIKNNNEHLNINTY